MKEQVTSNTSSSGSNCSSRNSQTKTNCSLVQFIVLPLLLCSLVILAACGRKGPPKAPELSAPAVVRFFNIEGKVDGFQLTWFAPLEDASGGSLSNLVSFDVYKAIYEKDETPDFEKISEVTLAKDPQTGEYLQPTEDTQFSYLDKDATPGKRYEYYIVSNNTDGEQGLKTGSIRGLFAGEASTFERQ